MFKSNNLSVYFWLYCNLQLKNTVIHFFPVLNVSHLEHTYKNVCGVSLILYGWKLCLTLVGIEVYSTEYIAMNTSKSWEREKIENCMLPAGLQIAATGKFQMQIVKSKLNPHLLIKGSGVT